MGWGAVWVPGPPTQWGHKEDEQAVRSLPAGLANLLLREPRGSPTGPRSHGGSPGRGYAGLRGELLWAPEYGAEGRGRKEEGEIFPMCKPWPGIQGRVAGGVKVSSVETLHSHYASVPITPGLR